MQQDADGGGDADAAGGGVRLDDGSEVVRDCGVELVGHRVASGMERQAMASAMAQPMRVQPSRTSMMMTLPQLVTRRGTATPQGTHQPRAAMLTRTREFDQARLPPLA